MLVKNVHSLTSPISLCPSRPVDFAQPVSFENADIGHCPDLGPEPEHEKEDEDRASVMIHPEPDFKEKLASATSPPPPPLPPSHVSVLCSCGVWGIILKIIFLRGTENKYLPS